ncbi:MAG: hypothetical protein M3178_06650 [Pseudomonadota bacterium]|nr:hypothetical protein [Pseudomonadota bacterium]
MTILKLALLGSFRIAILGSLKLALFVYTLFLSDASFAGGAPEGNGHVGDAAGLRAFAIVSRATQIRS